MTTRSARPKPEPAPEPAAEHTAAPPVCPVAWCPVCTAVSAAQPLHPEIVGHLLKAGTELWLAVQALVDQRAQEVAPQEAAGPTRLEKIDVG